MSQSTHKSLLNLSLFILPWVIPALISVYLKYTLMSNSGYRIVEHGLGKESQHGFGSSFSYIDALSFYSLDVLFAFLLIPLLIIFSAIFISRRLSIFFSTALSILAIGIIFVQIQSQQIIGSTTSLSMLADSISFFIQEPGIAAAYINPIAYIKLSILVIATGILSYFTVLATQLNKGKENSLVTKSKKIVQYFIVFSITIATILALVPFIFHQLPNTKYHESNIVNFTQSLFGKSISQFNLANPSKEKLSQAFSRLTNASESVLSTMASAIQGVHKNDDLIIILLETAPSAVAQLSIENTELPNISSLLTHSIYSNNHYSTVPYTSLALYSIFTSWYPTGDTQSVFMDQPSELPSFIQPLKKSGYATKVYIPCMHSSTFDEVFYAKIGISSEFSTCKSEQIKQYTKNNIKQRIRLDKTAFNAMKTDIQNNINQHTNYAYIFAPQIGHAPWLNLPDQHLDRTKDKGKKIVALQDQWIGELIDLLKNNNKLKDTVILVTGDHGIRTKVEDPNFPGNIIDEYSYRVPLVLHAPKASAVTGKELTHITSHIDILPTMIEIFGMNETAFVPQGMGLTIQSKQRSVFFTGDYYFGADGYYENGQYYSYSSITGEVFMSERKLNFSQKNSLLFSSEEYSRVKNKIEDFNSLQNYWTSFFLTSP